jgi:hypothetical protein
MGDAVGFILEACHLQPAYTSTDNRSAGIKQLTSVLYLTFFASHFVADNKQLHGSDLATAVLHILSGVTSGVCRKPHQAC